MNLLVFVKFCKIFYALDLTSAMMGMIRIKVDKHSAHAVKQWKEHFLKVLDGNCNSLREDYNELIQLCMIFLWKNILFSFKKPGAQHKACWISKLLYAFIICCFCHFCCDLLPLVVFSLFCC